MAKHYDETLRNKLNATWEDGAVLNQAFRTWADHIKGNLIQRFPYCGDRYQQDPDKTLLALCREHAKKFQKSKKGKQTVMLTHPFYLHLSEMDTLKNQDTQREAREYLDALLSFLRMNRERSKVEVVALETVHHYASATSLLLERGLINQVIFTLYDTGRPLDKNKFQRYETDEIFFGGGYNGRCLSASIRAIKGTITSGQVWAIKDLILNSPGDCRNSLVPWEVKDIDSSRIISLEDTVKRLGLAR